MSVSLLKCHNYSISYGCVHAGMHLNIFCISLFSHHTHSYNGVSGCFDLLLIETDQGLSLFYILSFFNQIFKSIALHIHCINADMQQNFHVIGSFSPQA